MDYLISVFRLYLLYLSPLYIVSKFPYAASLWLFAIIWAESKSLHNRLISVFSGCVHFATQRRGVESV